MLEPQLQRFESTQVKPWLELVKEVQTTSEGWEAAYLEKPCFSPDCDFTFNLNSHLIGIVAGHLINDTPREYSLEILAIRPDHQGKGLGIKLLEAISSHLEPGSSLNLYTQSAKVASWYQHIGWTKRRDNHLLWRNHKDTEDSLALGEGHRFGKPIWHYQESCPWISKTSFL